MRPYQVRYSARCWIAEDEPDEAVNDSFGSIHPADTMDTDPDEACKQAARDRGASDGIKAGLLLLLFVAWHAQRRDRAIHAINDTAKNLKIRSLQPVACYYTAVMLREHSTRLLRSRWRPLIGVLCIALILLAGTLSVTHGHQQGEVSHADCGLCLASHMAVQIAVAPPAIIPTQASSLLESYSPISRPQTDTPFALFSRPPPADSHRS